MKEAESGYLVHPVTVTSKASDEGFVLMPVNLTPPGRTPALVMSGTATEAGYTLHFAGTATEAQVRALRALAPPLGDGLQEVVKPDGVGGVAKGEAVRVMKVDATCSRAWGGGADVCGGCGGGSEAETAVGVALPWARKGTGLKPFLVFWLFQGAEAPC